MSKRMLFLSGGLVAVVALLGLALVAQIYFNQPTSLRASVANAQQQATPTPAQSGTISVNGTGHASATPDLARMSIGVESVGADVSKVVGDVNTKQATIIAKLKALGVTDNDIQTTNFNVSIERKPPTPGSATEGPVTYRATNNAQVTIRKTDQIAALIEAAVQAGANNIYGINFSVADPAPMMSEARSKAITDARTKAEALAKAAGVKLGRIISISETPFGFPQPVFADARAGGAAPIEAGELQVTAQVQVIFAIEPQ